MKYVFLTFLVVFSATNARSQTAKPTLDGCVEYGGARRTILKPLDRVFKIKTIVGANSGTAREGDYVEFKTLEKIYSTDNPSKVLFDKDTSIFGVVSHREGRRFPLRRGKIEIRLKPWVNWNGESIEMAILRHGPVKRVDKPKRRNDPCKESDDAGRNCVAGRGNAPTGLLVSGTAAGLVAGLSAYADDEDRSVIAATALFNAIKEVANLLGGVEVEVSKDEIFDLFIQTATICSLPEEAKPAADKPKP